MDEKINLNLANADQLATLPGIGAALAEKIVQYRTTVGRFRVIAELCAVDGITPEIVKGLEALVTVTTPGDTAFEIEIKLQPTAGASGTYSGHRVAATYEHRHPQAPTDEGAQPETPLAANSTPRKTAKGARPASPARDEQPPAPPVLELEYEWLTETIATEVSGDGVGYLALPALVELRGQVIFEVQAPDGERLHQARVAVDTLSATLSLSVNPKAFNMIQPNTNLGFGAPSKLRGRLIDAKGQRQLANRQVVIFGKAVDSHEKENAQALLVTRTDATGYFSGTYPVGFYTEAYALIAAGDAAKTIPIHLEKRQPNDSDEQGRIFPATVLLVLGDVDLPTDESDCTCKTADNVPRFPDNQDLITAEGVFSDDLGTGGCVDFTKPNRVLEEYSYAYVVRTSEPEVSQVQAGRLSRLQRGPLTLENSADWDDTPTTYQATTIAHGHLLRLKQEWVADGYSMGDLLYSLPLAPAQKKQIAIVDWERREQAARLETLSENEALAASLTRDRDINEIVNGSLSENIRAGSKASTGSFGGGAGIGGFFSGIGALLGIGGGTSSSSSSAWQDSSRQTAFNSLQQLRDRTIQSASAVRSQRSTVIQTARQGERLQAQTETIANYNHCHAITIQYFEVLRHFLVRQRLVDVQECLFVPLPMSPFDQAKALRWRDALRAVAPTTRLQQGFAALERIANNYQDSDLPLGAFADDDVTFLTGDLNLRFKLARPRDKNDTFDADAWAPIATLLGANMEDFYNRFLKDQQTKEEIFLAQLGPRIAEALVQKLTFVAVKQNNSTIVLPIDATLTSNFQNDASLYVTLRMKADLPPLKRSEIRFIQINSVGGVLPGISKVIVESGQLQYRTAYFNGTLFRQSRILNDLTGSDPVRIDTPLSREELRKPRAEDAELARQLLAHLNENIERYHHAIWGQMGPDRRYMLLDGFQAPNGKGRSVASVVENELIGIVGNCLVLPVSRGVYLDPTYAQNAENPIDLINLYQPDETVEPMRIAVPTKGVYAEAVMGACNSCEVKDETRFWRWEESPIPDSVPAIQPTSTDSRRVEPPNLTAQPFPSPIINLQNAPAAPDPTGLAGIIQLLSNPNLFKDLTGLELNQKNAIAALQGAFDTAKFFGGQAANLALQGRMSKDIDKAVKKIQDAQSGGLISDQQASKLTEDAIRSMIGGGAGPETQSLTQQAPVRQLIEKAGNDPAAKIEVQQGSERVNVDRGAGSGEISFDYTVPGIVPDIRQPSPNTCWATAAAIMVSWRQQESHEPRTIAKEAGKAPDGVTYETKFKNDEALSDAHQADFTQKIGAVAEPPQSYTPRAILDLLQRFGPLWIQNDESPNDPKSNHYRVVYGIYGDGSPDHTFVRIMDPWRGPYAERYSVFQAKYERPAIEANQFGWTLLIQMAHFPDGKFDR